MTPQERKQYEWYERKYERADMSRDPEKERENLHDHGCIISSSQPYAARAQ